MILTDCRKCAKSGSCYVGDIKPCIGYEPKKLTNADRIRQMTDEELAEFLNDVNMCSCSYAMGKSPCDGEKCPCWNEWLKEEGE